MNLLKKNPTHLFQLIAAIILILLAFYLVSYFEGIRLRTTQVEEIPLPPTGGKTPVREEEQYIDFDQFGVVHLEVDSPSYAKSNFDVDPGTAITLYFNEPVDVGDIRSKFSLIDTETGQDVLLDIVSSGLKVTMDEEDESAWKWQEVWQEKVVLAPVNELEPITMYEVVVDAGYLNKSGTGTAPNEFRFEFLTADEPGVLNTNIDEQPAQLREDQTIKVVFRSPMSQDELVGKVTLSPAVDLDVNVNDKIMVIENELSKGEYQLAIPANVVDIYGRELGEDHIYNFTVI